MAKSGPGKHFRTGLSLIQRSRGCFRMMRRPRSGGSHSAGGAASQLARTVGA